MGVVKENAAPHAGHCLAEIDCLNDCVVGTVVSRHLEKTLNLVTNMLQRLRAFLLRKGFQLVKLS